MESTTLTSTGRDPLTHKVIGAAMTVHAALGPGLLESTYLQCLCCELSLHGVEFKKEVPLPVTYRDMKIDCGYRVDLLVQSDLIVELKSVEALKPIHKSQLITYMRLSKIRTGLLINFNVSKLVDGVNRFVL